MDRKNFLRTAMFGAAVATVGTSPLSLFGAGKTPEKAANNKTELKLSFQEGIAPGANLEERLDFMEKNGIKGLEVGGGGLDKRVNELSNLLRGRDIKISAICAGFEGFIISKDKPVQQKCMDTMREILAAAGSLGSVGVIIVPAFNHQANSMPHSPDTRNFLVEQLNILGDFAATNKTSVILEPLNRKEAHYLRQVGDAAMLCKDINNKGVTCMGDFWHMTFEEASDYAAFTAAGKHLSHVHIASRARRSIPGEDIEVDNYIDGFRALKEMGYSNYVSFECGCKGDRNIVVPESIKLLRDQWKQA